MKKVKCFGGPLDGQFIVVEGNSYQVARNLGDRVEYGEYWFGKEPGSIFFQGWKHSEEIKP